MKTTYSNTQTQTGNLVASRVVFQIKMTVLLTIIFLLAMLKGSCADSTNVITAKNAVNITIAGKQNSRSISHEGMYHQFAGESRSVGISLLPKLSTCSLPSTPSQPVRRNKSN